MYVKITSKTHRSTMCNDFLGCIPSIIKGKLNKTSWRLHFRFFRYNILNTFQVSATCCFLWSSLSEWGIRLVVVHRASKWFFKILTKDATDILLLSAYQRKNRATVLFCPTSVTTPCKNSKVRSENKHFLTCTLLSTFI